MKAPRQAPSCCGWAGRSSRVSAFPMAAPQSRPRAVAPVVALAAVAAAASAGALSVEPPDWPQLSCSVVRQQGAQALRLQLRFENTGSAPVELPAGPHLVLYADQRLTESLDPTARLDRVTRTAVTVPAGGAREELFIVAEPARRRLACTGPAPAGAALYFYRFSPVPQQRCRLSGLDLANLAAAQDCAPAAGR